MKKQFTKVCCKRGAPMGRDEYGCVDLVDGKISLFRVTLDEGYDDGGAYWGCATSYRDQLYCARTPQTEEYRRFIRAGSREEARALLEIPQCMLLRPTMVSV